MTKEIIRMTDKKFTDEEIIQALECHINAEDCVSCEMFGRCDEIILTKLVLDLINRQKAEIERLEKEIQVTKDAYTMLQTKIEIIKSEVVKEFAEKLCDGKVSNDKTLIEAKVLLKEMVGEEE